MTDVTTIKTKNWSISATTFGEVVQDLDDINQCIGIILETVPGTDPLRPFFGADVFKYLDQPVNIAVPNIIKAAVYAIKTFEPRVVVTSAKAVLENSSIFVTIKWETLSTSLISSTTVRYGKQ